MRLFLQFEIGKLIKFYRTKTLAKVITTLMFLGVFLFVALGIYGFFVSGFRFINIEAVEDIRFALTLFLYEVFFVILAGIIFVSSLVTGVFNLFKGDTNDWVISSPGYRLFPRLVFIRSTLATLFPTAILFTPAILAFNRVYDVSALSLFFILLSVLLLIVLINATALSLIVLVAKVYEKVTQKIKGVPFSFKGLVLLLMVTLGALLTYTWKTLTNVDLVNLFRAEDVDTYLSVSNISGYFSTLPTHPFALEIVSFQAGNTLLALTNFGVLALLAIVAYAVWFFISPLFYVTWLKFQEGNGAVRSEVGGTQKAPYLFTGSPLMALFKKEWLVSSRNLRAVVWFLFLFVIWLLQIGTSVLLDNNIRRYGADLSEKMAIVQGLQFIIAVYFIAAFALRFVFPSFSTEKKTAWIVGSAPLSFSKIFYGKYLFYVTFFAVLGGIMSYVTTAVLDLSLSSALYEVLLLGSVIIFVVTFALSLGALFPNTETDDPEVITTSMPGLFFTALSLIYGTISGWILYSLVLGDDITKLVLFVVGTLFLTLTLFIKTPRLMKRRALS